MEMGQYLRAAAVFEQLALGAQKLQIPRAPFLFIQAGRGYLLGGDHQRGFDHIKQGLALLAESSRWVELQRVGRRVIAEIEELGLSKQSLAIRDWLVDALPEKFSDLNAVPTQGAQKRAHLPTHCPQCGGALDPGTVNWLDEATAECLYCGSPVRAEG